MRLLKKLLKMWCVVKNWFPKNFNDLFRNDTFKMVQQIVERVEVSENWSFFFCFKRKFYFCLVYNNGRWISKRWHEVQVGDFVLVEDNEHFPADLLFLSSRWKVFFVCFQSWTFVFSVNQIQFVTLKHRISTEKRIWKFNRF